MGKRRALLGTGAVVVGVGSALISGTGVAVADTAESDAGAASSAAPADAPAPARTAPRRGTAASTGATSEPVADSEASAERSAPSATRRCGDSSRSGETPRAIVVEIPPAPAGAAAAFSPTHRIPTPRPRGVDDDEVPRLSTHRSVGDDVELSRCVEPLNRADGPVLGELTVHPPARSPSGVKVQESGEFESIMAEYRQQGANLHG
jgi:hypothetical protein